MKPLWSGIVLIFILSATTALRADEPLRPPARHSACSRSGEACVTSDPQDGTFVHGPQGGAVEASPWRIPEWFRTFWVLDGQHLITGYNGLNLVPLNDPEDTTILRFWRSGELMTSYTLQDLGYRRQDFQKTVSHYHWGDYTGLDSKGRFGLKTVDGRALVFDPKTGTLVPED